jgi:hypothetical protein
MEYQAREREMGHFCAVFFVRELVKIDLAVLQKQFL